MKSSWIHILLALQIASTEPFSTTVPQSSSASSSSSATSQSAGHEEDIISVFDNVIPPASRDMLHVAASKSGLSHKVFSRPIQNPENSPIIELALDAILTEMEMEMEMGMGMGDVAEQAEAEGGDGGSDADADAGGVGVGVGVVKQYVEYWARQEFRHIEAHADVDEHLAKDEDGSMASSSSSMPSFRYPQNGHVLYLKIGSEVRGPTCVFPNTSTGGQLIQKQQQKENDDGEQGGTNQNVDVVIVPAVEGRLLRFRGDALHAVPRPADLWFLSFVRGAPEFKPEEKWGRSVILFNTWSGMEHPPKDVPTVQSSDESSSARTNKSTSTSMQSRMVNEREDWEDTFAWKNNSNKNNNDDDKTCNASHEEQNGKGEKDQDGVKAPVEEATSKVKIWLLGNERRRDYPMRTVKMTARSSARDAFLESSVVSHLTLES